MQHLRLGLMFLTSAGAIPIFGRGGSCITENSVSKSLRLYLIQSSFLLRHVWKTPPPSSGSTTTPTWTGVRVGAPCPISAPTGPGGGIRKGVSSSQVVQNMLKIVSSVRVVPGHVEKRRSQCPSSLEVSTSKMIFRHKMESWSSLKMDFVINLSSQIWHRCQDTGNNLYDWVLLK